MDWIIWLIAIVVIVAVVWWLLNRNNSRRSPGSAGTGTAATHDSPRPHPHDAVHGASHRGALSGGGSAASASAAGLAWMPTAAGFSQAEPDPEPESEWETQWSETPPAEPHAAIRHEAPHGGPPAQGAQVMEGSQAAGAAAGATAAAATTAAATTPATEPTAGVLPVHHPEYTEPHAPTLPGAESAAAEAVFADTSEERAPEPAAKTEGASPADADVQQATVSSAAAGTAPSHAAEPAGHLALDEPYGEGSAAPAADGSGPQGFTVKGNASSMIYLDESSPAFDETRAEVWFVSIAHAEAAGFRPPRRSRQ